MSSINDSWRFPVIMGATASGKSALALEIARDNRGEIVSADSMQLYRGLNIGTAKPTAEQRRSVPHHLIDAAELTKSYDVFRFLSAANALIAAIRAQGKLPIVAGGTGLYLRALLYGLDPLPADPELRRRLDFRYGRGEHDDELRALVAKDAPADRAKFGANRRKLLRAREVFLLTGKPMTELQKRWKRSLPRPDARSFVLVWPPGELRSRIASRCEQMLRAGWIEETEQLLRRGLAASPTARQALGYREIAAYLTGKLHRAELPERIISATWRFARRQNTWFRTQHPEALRIAMPDPGAAQIIRRACGIA